MELSRCSSIRTCATLTALLAGPFAAGLALAGCDRADPGDRSQVQGSRSRSPMAVAPLVSPVILARLPHDPEAFTQGFAIHRKHFLEGTGLRGFSSLRKYPVLGSGAVRGVRLDDRYFGEGVAVLASAVYQLTWKSGKVLVYEPEELRFTGTLLHDLPEAWGLATDGSNLILSDGSDLLRFMDPRTLRTRRTLAVVDGSHPVKMINELEHIGNGEVLANIWPSDSIAHIDLNTGRVMNWIDFREVREQLGIRRASQTALNGIAFDSVTGALYVTGKLWPEILEVAVPALGLGRTPVDLDCGKPADSQPVNVPRTTAHRSESGGPG